MPVIESEFHPPPYLCNGHVQTILSALLPRRINLAYARERLELPDGDFLDLDWSKKGNRRLAIVSHGLEGSSSNSSIRGLVAALNASGWDALAWNFRGCSGEPNRLLRFYHSGETEDLGSVIQHAAKSYGEIALVGFSLGGNMTLKYLGEAQPHPSITRGVAVSVPADLTSSSQALDQRPLNRLYLWRFIRSLIAKVEAKALDFPADLDTRGLRTMKTFLQFDDRYTARVHGFAGAEDYWRKSSARQFMPAITIPTLLLNAQDDPFLDAQSFPWPEARASTSLFLEAPEDGGHIGFLQGLGPDAFWAESRICEFLNQ